MFFQNQDLSLMSPWLIKVFLLTGFEGVNCEVNIDDCPGQLCQNGGKCIDGVNTYTCDCPPEWSGKYCNEDVDECSGSINPCQNGATCTNEEGGYDPQTM